MSPRTAWQGGQLLGDIGVPRLTCSLTPWALAVKDSTARLTPGAVHYVAPWPLAPGPSPGHPNAPELANVPEEESASFDSLWERTLKRM